MDAAGCNGSDSCAVNRPMKDYTFLTQAPAGLSAGAFSFHPTQGDPNMVTQLNTPHPERSCRHSLHAAHPAGRDRADRPAGLRELLGEDESCPEWSRRTCFEAGPGRACHPQVRADLLGALRRWPARLSGQPGEELLHLPGQPERPCLQAPPGSLSGRTGGPGQPEALAC